MANLLACAGLLCAVASAVVHAGAGVAAQPSAVDTSLVATLSAVRAYLAQYQTDLTFILADEDTTQRILRLHPGDAKMPRRRSTRSEVYFKFIEADGAWMAVRSVATVDGVAVEDRPDLRAALLNQSAAQVARTFKAFNSQFNIGRLFRNFNEPTLALGILDPKRAGAFEFTRKGAKAEGNLTVVTLGFKHRRGAEAFVYDLLMRPAPVEGEVVVEAGSGRVRRTVLKVTMGSVKAELTTAYEHDPKTDLWVPVNFLEFYEDHIPRSLNSPLSSDIQDEAISCESKYTNFRRFTATMRIK